MDENTVLKEQLTKEMIDAGARLTEELDKTGVPIQAALWFFDSEINEWRLLFASRQVSQTGLRPLFEGLQEALKKLGPQAEYVPSSDIRLVRIRDEPVRSLMVASPTGPGISRLRFKKSVANGHFIDDALIYRIAA